MHFGPADVGMLQDCFGLANDPNKHEGQRDLAGIEEVELWCSACGASLVAAVLRVTPGATHVCLQQPPHSIPGMAEVSRAQWVHAVEKSACVGVRARMDVNAGVHACVVCVCVCDCARAYACASLCERACARARVCAHACTCVRMHVSARSPPFVCPTHQLLSLVHL